MRSKLCLLWWIGLLLILSSGLQAAEPDVFIYRVHPGDTVIQVAHDHLEDPRQWPHVARINGLKNANRIYPGMLLKIPVDLLKGTLMPAEVTFSQGEVHWRPEAGTEWQPLRLEDTIWPGNWLKTGADSRMQITYDDGSSFMLRAGTQSQVTAARRKGPGLSVNRLFLQIGRVFADIKKKITPGSRVSLESVTAVAGLRGTRLRFGVDAEETTRSEVLEGSVALTAMDREVMLAAGQGTLVRKGEAPMDPVDLLPPPDLRDPQPVYRSMPLVLAFSTVPGAVAYEVVLARDIMLHNIVKADSIGPSEAFRLWNLEDGTYYLQTSSTDALGLEGPPTPPQTIRVRVNPLPPLVSSPTADRSYRDLKVTFEWLKVADAVRYRLQVARDPHFEQVVVEKADLEYPRLKVDLPEFGVYYSRLCSTADDGFTAAWSDSGRFEVTPPPPSPPVDPPQVDDNDITLRWQDMGPQVRYHFQLAADPEFKQIRLDRTLKKPQITFKKPKKAGSYYVRTSTIEAEGYEGDFSAPQSFDVPKGPNYRLFGILTLLGMAALIIF